MTDISYATIRELRAAYISGELTVRRVVTHFMERIARLDRGAEGLNSVLELNPDVLFIADQMDKRLSDGGELEPMFGVCVLLKDNINTGDRLHTSAGSLALKDNYAPKDAHLVSRLRKAGALILGKANMSEFAMHMTKGAPSGYSSRGGQVVSPFNRDKTPSGSSSGSGVAVAAGLCTVSVGTETGGSIVAPTRQNGLAGMKPTLGLVSRSGIIPISSTLDTAGPMCRTVEDMAILLNVISGSDEGDAAAFHDLGRDYSSYIDPDGLRGLRVGVNRDGDRQTPGRDDLRFFDELLALLKEAGAELVDIPTTPKYDIGSIMTYEFKSAMNYYLAQLGDYPGARTLSDIIKYNQEHAKLCLKHGQVLLLQDENETSGTLTEPEYLNCMVEREGIIAELHRIYDENNIDLMVYDSFSAIAPYAGFPSMSVPLGIRSDRLPQGSFWMARPFGEPTLIRACGAVEKRLGLRFRF